MMPCSQDPANHDVTLVVAVVLKASTMPGLQDRVHPLDQITRVALYKLQQCPASTG